MPTYDYHCKECGHEMEAFHKISDPALKSCPACKSDSLQRGPGGGIGLALKGLVFTSPITVLRRRSQPLKEKSRI